MADTAHEVDHVTKFFFISDPPKPKSKVKIRVKIYFTIIRVNKDVKFVNWDSTILDL